MALREWVGIINDENAALSQNLEFALSVGEFLYIYIYGRTPLLRQLRNHGSSFSFADRRRIVGMQRELCVIVQRGEPSMSQPVPIHPEIVFHPSRDGPDTRGSVSPYHRNSPFLRGCRCHDRKHVSPARCQLTAAAARNLQGWPFTVRLHLNRTNTVVNAHPAFVGHAEGGHQCTYRIVGFATERNRKVPDRLGCAAPANPRHSCQHQDCGPAANPNPSDLRSRHIKVT